MRTNKSMLIVDDNQSILEVLKIGLSDKGFLVDAYETGEAALKDLKINKYNYALLDIRLPGINGLELTREINKIDSAVIVILMTGYPDIKNVIEALRNRVYDYIIKPFKLEQIMAIIERAENTLGLLFENKKYLAIIENLKKENDELRKKIKQYAPMVYKIPGTGNTNDTISETEVINSYIKHQDDSILSYDDKK